MRGRWGRLQKSALLLRERYGDDRVTLSEEKKDGWK